MQSGLALSPLSRPKILRPQKNKCMQSEIGCFLQESITLFRQGQVLTTLCFIECSFSKTNTIREILAFATELARLPSITSFWFTSCILDTVQSMCLVRCLQEEKIDVQIHCNTQGIVSTDCLLCLNWMLQSHTYSYT